MDPRRACCASSRDALRRVTRRVFVAALLSVAPALGAQRPTRAERFTDWTHPVFPRGEYLERRARAFAALGENDVLLIPSAEGTSSGETFRQADDFEYLAGLEVPRSVLALDVRTHTAILFVPRTDPRFDNAGRPNDFPGRTLASDPALRALSGVDSVLVDDALDERLARWAARGAHLRIDAGGAETPLTVGPSAFAPPTPGQLLASFVQRTQPSLSATNAYAILAGLRMIKSPREIAALRESARLAMIAIARGASRATPGADERTLTGQFIANCRALGAQREGFTPIIKSGDNAVWPWRILGAQYDRRSRTMRAGELVIYDVGCERDHYISDVGRTVPVSGTFTPRQRELVEIVRRVSDAVIAAARPGITLAELQRAAALAIPEPARRYMQAPLYFGHHIGLDSGDPSLRDALLAPGMVFTIEPWYYNHDEGFGAFIEDELLITTTGAENLTAALPRDADGLERMRAGGIAALVDANALRTRTRDGLLAFTLERPEGTVRVYDLLNGVDAALTPVCPGAVAGALTPDDVAFVVQCPDKAGPRYVNTASYALSSPPAMSPVAARPSVGAVRRKSEVIVIGTIHGEHRTSQRYGTSVLRRLLEAMRPDYVLTEIAPNRLQATQAEFAATGRITEPRVTRFPEYVDVLFPLTRTMKFTIVPTAGWTRPMDQFRTAAMKRFEADPSRRSEWEAYTRANQVADSLVALAGADNPYFINSNAYDEIQTIAHEPYNRLFNAELGPGGWDNINVTHFGNIARALDAHRGDGKRFVITYGAGHKEWFLRALRLRDDVTLLDVAPFLAKIGAKR